MTAVTSIIPPVISQTPVRTAPVATDADGDNDGSSSAPAVSSAAHGPATITSLSSAAQAILGGK